MRKALLLLSVLALVIAPMSAAQAKSTKYKVSLGFTLIGMKGKDLDVSRGHEHDKVKVHGKVRGGKVKGKKVYIYRINLAAPGSAKKYVGSAKLSKKGKYSKTDRPSKGGIWRYTVVKKKSGKIQRAEKSRNFWVYQFAFISEFPVQGAGVAHVSAEATTTPNGSDKGKYSDAFTIDAGSELTALTTGYRCKGVTFHVGVASDSRTDEGSYFVYKGDRLLFGDTMNKNTPVHQVTDAQRKTFSENVPDGNLRIVTTGAKFLIGLPKLACAYPSRNND